VFLRQKDAENYPVLACARPKSKGPDASAYKFCLAFVSYSS
jgi:hypothetical protein